MKQKSVMKHQFSQVPKVSTPRSTFNRTHSHKTTFDGGKLIPFYVDEVLPGDTFNVNANLFGRLATPIVPVMDNIYLDTHYFYVPNRLVWDNFKKFMGEQANPEDSTDYLVPQLTHSHPEGSLGDYFGLPINTNIAANSLFFRAYNLIWNEWFRDQNLQDSVHVNKGDSGDSSYHFNILRRGKRHDYFTSALPWPQKGPGVELPLGTSAPVVGTSTSLQVTDGTLIRSINYNTSNNRLGTGPSGQSVGTTASYSDVGEKFLGLATSGDTGLQADLSGATAATINSLRQAFQLQRLAEKDARGGTRYTEIVRSHFNVTSPDARLQRPEFLGGRTSRLDITPVAQTSGTQDGQYPTSSSPQGNLSGFGTVAQTNDGFTKSFTEHGIIIGLCSVRADLTYQKGLNRMFSRRTKYDFYWPTLAHLGEQEILNKEIYAQGNQADDEVFGYQERWAEYRYYPSKITGKFRSDAAASLDVWHQSQDFASLPQLNDTFIEDNPPLDRLVAVTNEPHILLDSHIEVRTARTMPTYSVPGLIDHL